MKEDNKMAIEEERKEHRKYKMTEWKKKSESRLQEDAEDNSKTIRKTKMRLKQGHTRNNIQREKQ